MGTHIYDILRSSIGLRRCAARASLINMRPETGIVSPCWRQGSGGHPETSRLE